MSPTPDRKAGRRKHGLSRSPEYRTWRSMLARCQNPATRFYRLYGGRGISVCERWLRFEAFYEDMGSRPSSSHSLDRVDNSKGYAPDNCRWATPLEQGRNTRHNRLVTINGVTRCLTEWSEITGVPYNSAQKRIIRNRDPEAVFFGAMPVRNSGKTHCPKGHKYEGDNLYTCPNTNHRICRTCQRDHEAKRRRPRRKSANRN